MDFVRTLLLRRPVLVYSLHLVQYLSLELFLVGLSIEARLGSTLPSWTLGNGRLTVNLIDILAILLSLLLAAQTITAFALLW